MKTIIGIDPGQTGGIAIISHNDVQVMAIPVAGKEIDVNPIVGFLWQHYTDITKYGCAYIEKVHSMPQQGVASSFKFGFNAGILHGIVRTLGIPLKLVTPQTWKKTILAGTDKSKNAAIDYCVRSYPGLDLKASERAKKPHLGIVEALCIAEYGWKQENIEK